MRSPSGDHVAPPRPRGLPSAPFLRPHRHRRPRSAHKLEDRRQRTPLRRFGRVEPSSRRATQPGASSGSVHELTKTRTVGIHCHQLRSVAIGIAHEHDGARAWRGCPAAACEREAEHGGGYARGDHRSAGGYRRASRIPCGKRAVSSVGRAPALQAGGHWFEPSTAHRTPLADPETPWLSQAVPAFQVIFAKRCRTGAGPNQGVRRRPRRFRTVGRGTRLKVISAPVVQAPAVARPDRR